jgi:repressor LexA
MSDFGKNIKELRKNMNMSQEDLATKLGTSKQVISRYENGQRVPKITVAKEYADILGCTLETLIGTTKETLPSVIQPISEIRSTRIPLIGNVAAGQPILAEEDYETYIDSPCKADYALRVEGDSMEPGFIDGDIIYIKAQDDVDDGQIAVVLLDDSAALKHVYHIPNGLMLTSDNPKYPPMHMTFEDYNVIRVLGIVVGFTRMFKGSVRV